MSNPRVIRVLQDPPLDGATNMARDEALMTCVGRKESAPTLRLYQWHPPTISLGYFQPFADYKALPPPAGDLAVVRRLTGGGAILHDLELTYSLTLPIDHVLLSEGPNRLYELAHDAILACLSALGMSVHRGGATDDSGPTRGPFFCYARRHCLDILTGDGKVAGSAQRRTRHAVLQHGSIILGNRFEQHPAATMRVDYEEAVRRIRSAMVEHMAEACGQTFNPGTWLAAELAEAQALNPKYAGHAWTRRA